MPGSFRIGRIAGIEISVHVSWIIVFALVAWSNAVGYFPERFPGWRNIEYSLAGIISSLLLFVSVLLHELAHAFVARRRGLEVAGITLFIFGGVATLKGEPREAGDEFAIAVVGPLASLAIAAACLLLRAAFGLAYDPIEATLTYLAEVNLMLALFNLLPGFPLDGGRVFRAIVWQITGSFDRATRIATTVGQAISYLFILGGLFIAFTGSFGTGLWLVFIGWFLNNAASQSQAYNEMQRAFRGVLVQQLMQAPAVTVPPQLSLRELVDQYVLRLGQRSYPVAEGERLVGVISLAEIKSVPVERWPLTRVGEVMRPLVGELAVSPRDDLMRAVQILSDPEVNQIPVVEDGRLVGVLTRAQIVNFLTIQQELRARGGRI